jgi:hypothetical protein
MQIKLHDFDEGALNGLEERSPADAMRILDVFRTSNPQEKDNKCEMAKGPPQFRCYLLSFASIVGSVTSVVRVCSGSGNIHTSCSSSLCLHAAAYLCSLLKHKKRPDGRVCAAADRILQVLRLGSGSLSWACGTRLTSLLMACVLGYDCISNRQAHQRPHLSEGMQLHASRNYSAQAACGPVPWTSAAWTTLRVSPTMCRYRGLLRPTC